MPGNAKPRRRKHRGTQTGSISRRAQGRPRSRQEAMAQAKSRRSSGRGGKKRSGDRRDLPPTWKGAATRGVLFAALLLPVSLLFGQPIAAAIVLTVIAAMLYIPLGFYTEQFFFNRRQVKMQREREAQRTEKGG
jgi:Flp pilus assembly protein TadB